MLAAPTATPRTILFLVVGGLGAFTAIGMITIAVVMIFEIDVKPEHFQAIIQLTTTFGGLFGGMLINTRQPTTQEGAATAVTTESQATVEVTSTPEGK